MREPYEILRQPVITEKSMDGIALNKYTFEVALDANKIEIANAVETIHNVKVVKVNTVKVKGKTRRVGRYPQGKTVDRKKAIVTLAPGQRIAELFEGV